MNRRQQLCDQREGERCVYAEERREERQTDWQADLNVRSVSSQTQS